MTRRLRFLRNLLLIPLLTIVTAGITGAEDVQDVRNIRKELCDNVYLMRSLEAVYRSRSDKSPVPGVPELINYQLDILSRQPLFEPTVILPFGDSADIAGRIDQLMQRLEQTDNAEKSQVIQFNLAYEYLLLYLSFLNEKYLLDFKKDKVELREVDIDRLISSRELSLYLLQSRLHLQTLVDYPEEEKTADDQAGEKPQPVDVQKSSVNTSFTVRDNPELYLSAGFIAFILECEKLAGQFMLTAAGDADPVFELGTPSEATLQYFDEMAWNWLTILWKRYQLKSGEPVIVQPGIKPADSDTFSSYCPPAEVLYRIYRLYLNYHFMWRYVADRSDDSPFHNSLTRIMLQRLNDLQRDMGLNATEYYAHYIADCARDGGQSNFLPGLFFARRGYFMAQAMETEIAPEILFDLFANMFNQAAGKVSNNILYRSRIYNELVLFGVRLKSLSLMENRIYAYALMSMRIAPQDDYSGIEFARSTRLTMAYLLANLLDAKRRSGIHQGFERYRDLANSLYPLLISKDNHNWEYASMTHYALAVFYSRENPQQFNESLAMYHAKLAFLAPCEKVAITDGDWAWEQFFSLPAGDVARASLKLFLYFHNKYPTNPEAVIPTTFNADKIADKWLKESRTGLY